MTKAKSSLTPKEIDAEIHNVTDAIEDELGDEDTAGTIYYRLKQLETKTQNL